MTDTDAGTNVVPIKEKRGRFGKPGVDNPGRPRNAVNRNTRILKEALMIAAELEGSNGNGQGKLVGFLRKVAQEDIRAFCSMLSRIIPLQVIESRDEQQSAKKSTVYKSLEEVKRELASRGISMDIMMKLEMAERLADDEDGDGSDDARADGVL